MILLILVIKNIKVAHLHYQAKGLRFYRVLNLCRDFEEDNFGNGMIDSTHCCKCLGQIMNLKGGGLMYL